MAAFFYGLGREAFANGDIDWVSDDIRAMLIDKDVYTVLQNTHQFVSDLSGEVKRGTASMTGKTAALGVLDADDYTIPAVPGPTTVEVVVIYKHNASDAAAQLIAYLDDAAVTNLPFTPSGGDALITWDNGANRIGKL